MLGAVLALLLAATGMFAYYYIQFGRMINERLTGQIYQNTSRVYSAPGRIYVGESIRANDLATYLLRAGYQENAIDGSPGQFHVSGSTVEIQPSSESYFQGNNALRVTFSGIGISRIAQLSDGQQRDFAEIEPELITNLFDSSREKRRVVRFDDLPTVTGQRRAGRRRQALLRTRGSRRGPRFRRRFLRPHAQPQGARREHDRYAGGAHLLFHHQARMAPQG